MNAYLKKYCLLFGCGFLWGLAACSSSPDNPSEEPDPEPGPVEKNDFELSYWVDMDLTGSHLRGYWYNVAEREPEIPDAAVAAWIENACRQLDQTYAAGKLYVIYHRQYEPEEARQVMLDWKAAAGRYGIEVVPTLVLQSYGNPQTLNFTDEEAIGFARWCTETIHADELGIYDVYTRDGSGSVQLAQLLALREAVGNKLVRVGLQPGVEMQALYRFAVEDTWTAECQGRTNELWEDPVYYRGTKNYGRLLLQSWVNERIDTDSRRLVWNLIPVAWDYDTADELSYDCPGDDQFANDPPVPGRIALCREAIAACYPLGLNDPKFGGYSCDLHILQANSGGRGESPSFYESLRNGTDYNGDFGDTMREIAAVYRSLEEEKNKLPEGNAGVAPDPVARYGIGKQ